MTHLRKALLAAALAGAVALPAGAADPLENAIKARQSLMTLFSWNLGTLGAMAKGEAEYNAETAKTAAANLLALASMDYSNMWPAGSDSTAMPGKTRAKKDAWDTYPKVLEHEKELVTAATNLAAVAGDGLDALKPAVGATGKACGGCHKPFREEK